MNLRRVRWAVRLTLAFGVAASVAANILHAEHNPISQAIASWPPLALLLTIELVSRVPAVRRSMVILRVIATGVISGIAAWVSYWHMVGVAARYGETDTSPYLLPISVDGLIVVASISLVELAASMRVQGGVQGGVQVTEIPVASIPGLPEPHKPYSTHVRNGYPQSGNPGTSGPIPDDPLPAVDVGRRRGIIGLAEPITNNNALKMPDMAPDLRPKLNRGGDDLKAKALEWVQSYTGERTLTGQMVGAEFDRSAGWGRAILRAMKS